MYTAVQSEILPGMLRHLILQKIFTGYRELLIKLMVVAFSNIFYVSKPFKNVFATCFGDYLGLMVSCFSANFHSCSQIKVVLEQCILEYHSPSNQTDI